TWRGGLRRETSWPRQCLFGSGQRGTWGKYSNRRTSCVGRKTQAWIRFRFKGRRGWPDALAHDVGPATHDCPIVFPDAADCRYQCPHWAFRDTLMSTFRVPPNSFSRTHAMLLKNRLFTPGPTPLL